MNDEAVFALRGVDKIYDAGGTRFELTVPQLDVKRGGKLALIGESGSGKSTLLELLAMILTPTTSGTFGFTPVKGEPASDVGEIWKSRDSDRLGALRSRHIGYVLQHGGLLPYLTVRRNIDLSRRLLGLPVGEVAEQLAAKLGIAAQLDKLPSALSVGQRQRAAIARALAHEPTIVIADEPTAAIDPLNSKRIMDLLVGLVNELGVTLILATHAHELVKNGDFTLLELKPESIGEQSMKVTVGGN